MKELDRLLAESVDAAKLREATAFDAISANRPLVLFGAGGLGRRTVMGLRRAGVEPLAFCDNNPALWGLTVEGLPVMSLPEAARRYGRDAAFVVTIWGGHATDRMADREQQLRTAGCHTVLHWGLLYWKYPATLFPHYAANPAHSVLEQAETVRACADLWADEYSRLEYISQVRWRLLFDFDGLRDPVSGPIYFRHDLRPLSTHEVFVDCGAYDGDTVQSFIDHSHGAFEKIYAYEPDPANFARLAAAFGNRDRISLTQAAVGSRSGVVSFAADGNEASAVGLGDLQVNCVTLDEQLTAAHPTFIKMDIEGFELEALKGAQEIIRRDSPTLAVCVYHAQDHLWKIPLAIQAYNPHYSFHLRPHLRDVWDLVCYAIPR